MKCVLKYRQFSSNNKIMDEEFNICLIFKYFRSPAGATSCGNRIPHFGNKILVAGKAPEINSNYGHAPALYSLSHLQASNTKTGGTTICNL